MPLFDNLPQGETKTNTNQNRWAFSLPYASSATLILLDSRDDPPEDQPQFIKTHMMQMTAESGKKYSKRVNCPAYKRDKATEESECPLCQAWANMSKEEREASDWTVGYRAKTELPMTFLVRQENDEGEIEEYRTVRFSSDRKKDKSDEVSADQRLIKEAYNIAVKKELGEDTRGLTFEVSRGSKPESGPKPAGIGELSVPMSGIEYTELDDDNPEHKPYTMAEILEKYVITDEEEVAKLMAPFQE